jgi:hypothetical protein
MDPEKVKAVRDWPRPETVTGTRGFLGFANFYRKFIKGYSKIAEPLTALTKKDIRFVWTQNAQKAFETLREKFMTAPILAYFDPEKEAIVECDASDKAVGGTLSQRGSDGKLHPVAFYSKKLTPAELNYDIHDKELLDIVECLQQWRVYLEGPKYTVKVYSDHKNLTYFTTTKVLNRRQVRWAEILATYNFEILYRKGAQNGKEDALSRREDYIRGEVKIPHAMLDKSNLKAWKCNTQLNSTILRMLQTTASVEQRIRAAYPKDKTAERLIKHQRLIYVPATLREELIREEHESPGAGHPGIGGTMERTTRTYYFPGMKRKIEWVTTRGRHT